MHFQQAIVINVANNFVDVAINQIIHRCLIRGNLKFSKPRILVGDYVEVNFSDPDYPLVERILPRINELYRPSIANVDQVLIVSALVQPAFSSFLLNKLLTIFNFYHLAMILVFTKTDLVTKDHEVWTKVQAYQDLGIQSILLSNVTKQGLQDLKQVFPNKLSLLTGTSGVGKSTTLNSLDKDLKLWTQNISVALNRGKHTTTKSRLYFCLGGIIADTPGFSVFQLQGLTNVDIATNFPSFNNIWQKCKFRTCLHQQEPECAIKLAVKNKVISTFFYEDYCKIVGEFQHTKK
ncbi:ribosome small subunit-dependent GTPase A [Spiroplasma endosymbiont of Virgichneumon dumeticola]|uniref:ribosome small subunit-dependent GTPase A n=1 Tax=Spiroplasma endosymbiont of Virgichneumon dumeticola TaxID=3139323 RepID=UPI0035C93DA0